MDKWCVDCQSPKCGRFEHLRITPWEMCHRLKEVTRTLRWARTQHKDGMALEVVLNRLELATVDKERV